MATREIKEILYFEEDEVKEALIDGYCDETEKYEDWKITIDNGKTPAIIILTKNKKEEME